MRFVLLLLLAACGQTSQPQYPSTNENERAELKRRIQALENTIEQQQAQIESILATRTRAHRQNESILEQLHRIQTQLAKGGTPPNNPTRRRRGPDPAAQHAISIAGYPSRGNKRAPVVIVKAHEFACPACYHAKRFDEQILQQFGKRVQIVYRDFVVHPTRAWEAAFAACAANKQNRFDAMADAIWEKGFKARKFDKAHLETLASAAGLNMKKYRRDRDGACRTLTRTSHAEMEGFGVAGTPTYFINGKVLQRRSLAEVELMVKAEEKRYKARKNKRRKGRKWYKAKVVKTGQKPSPRALPQIP